METELDGKRIEMLKQAIPGLHKVGLMVSRTRDDYKQDRYSDAQCREAPSATRPAPP